MAKCLKTHKHHLLARRLTQRKERSKTDGSYLSPIAFNQVLRIDLPVPLDSVQYDAHSLSLQYRRRGPPLECPRRLFPL